MSQTPASKITAPKVVYDPTKSPRYILVVDDDADLAKSIAEALQPATQCKVIFAHKVNEAIVKLNNQRFDLIVLDLQFEHGSGENVLDHARKEPSERNRHTPVLIVSGYINPPVLKRIVPQVSGVLVKPFDKGALIEKAKTLLTEKK